MKEEKIWQMIDAFLWGEAFEVKKGVIKVVDHSHVCMMEIRNVKLKDGPWIIEGKGAKMKPVKYKDVEDYGNIMSPALPNIDSPCKISLGSTENIFQVLKQMDRISGLILIESNSKTLKLSVEQTVGGIEAIIPTTNIDGDGSDIRSQYALHYLIQPFRYLNPTSLEFGPNYPITLKGKNWTFFLAPRIEGDA
tara:strand:- start:553 stop:1131 length:579 start_codon:yes stop_codon:yes gene_type:complete